MQSISIVLCPFNGERFLDTQMKSLRAQEGVAEIVVEDDGSTDDTVSIVQRHAVQDHRIRLFRNSGSLGVARNFERAITLAIGPWIALSDQDDVVVRKSFGATLASMFKIEREDVSANSVRRPLPSRVMADKPLEKAG